LQKLRWLPDPEGYKDEVTAWEPYMMTSEDEYGDD
jgi:hypothetical protein